MIRAQLTRRAGTTRLEVRGHAGQAPSGEDLVCAGVSALVETLALGLKRYDPASETRLGDGVFSYFGSPTPEASVLIDTFAMGLRDLARTHARFLRFKEEGG